MDTKSRIGLFAGGLVLVGMVAYVMMPRAAAPQPDVATDATSLSGDLAAAAPSTQPAAAQPVAIVDPFAAPAAQVPADTAAAPAVPVAAVPAVDNNDVWARALDTGSAQPHSGGTLVHTSSLMAEAGNLAAPTADPGQKIYKVLRGDSPVSISTKLYGSAKYASQIMAANPGVDARRLKIGQELKLPDISAEAPAVASASSAQGDALPAAAATTGQKTYKVQSGDTLTRISTKLYGKGDMWKKIYAANKSKIGSDPAHLRAGMVLQIPDNVQ